jgi:hypothetical protein
LTLRLKGHPKAVSVSVAFKPSKGASQTGSATTKVR